MKTGCISSETRFGLDGSKGCNIVSILKHSIVIVEKKIKFFKCDKT